MQVPWVGDVEWLLGRVERVSTAYIEPPGSAFMDNGCSPHGFPAHLADASCVKQRCSSRLACLLCFSAARRENREDVVAFNSAEGSRDTDPDLEGQGDLAASPEETGYVDGP